MNNIVDDTLNIRRKDIDGIEYAVRLLPASDGFIIASEILKLVAPALGSGVDGLKNDAVFEQPKTFNDVAVSLITQMDKVDILKHIKRLLKDSTADSESIQFESYFMANYGRLIKVVEFALEANFSSFFTDNALKTQLMNFFLNLIDEGETSEQSPPE